MDAFIAHGIFNSTTDTYRPSNNNSCEDIKATLILFFLCPDPRQARDIHTACSTRLRIYPDSGVTIYLGGLKHLRYMGLS